MASKILFRQLYEPESSTYTYIIGCPQTHRAAIIDPVLEAADRDAKVCSVYFVVSQLMQELLLTPIYGLNTHVHADHVTGTGKLKKV